jgi:hypothetical protein
MGVHLHGLEWLLSTLFDASLLSTFEPPEMAALFLICAVPFWVRCGVYELAPLSLCFNYVERYPWTARAARAMLMALPDA